MAFGSRSKLHIYQNAPFCPEPNSSSPANLRKPLFYIKRATQAGLPRRLCHPKKWPPDCDLAALDGPSQRLRHKKKMAVGLRSGSCGFASGQHCFIQSEWDMLPGSHAMKLPWSFTRPPCFRIRTPVPVTLGSSVGPQPTAWRSWRQCHRYLHWWSPSASLPPFSLSWWCRLRCLRRWSPFASLPLSLRLPVSSAETFL
jgi:hypothetical protein